MSLFYDLLGPLWIEDRHLYLSGDISPSQDKIDCIDIENNEGDKVKARCVILIHNFNLELNLASINKNQNLFVFASG